MSTLEEKEKELTLLSHKIHKLKIRLTYMEEERRKLKIEYESLDRRQAMTDGRFKPCNVKKEVKRTVKTKDLSMEDVIKLAKKLGVNLNLE